MTTFASMVNEKKLKYAKIVKVFECIEETSEKLDVEKSIVAMILDSMYHGISFSYDHYLETGEVKIVFADEMKIFLPDGKVGVEDLGKIRENAQLTVKHMAINA